MVKGLLASIGSGLATLALFFPLTVAAETDFSNLVADKIMRELSKEQLTSFEGDWIYKRQRHQDHLKVMGIWAKTGVKLWQFHWSTLIRPISVSEPNFWVGSDVLLVGDGDDQKSFRLSHDGKTLTCVNCQNHEYWVLADDDKVDQEWYLRETAGKP